MTPDKKFLQGNIWLRSGKTTLFIHVETNIAVVSTGVMGLSSRESGRACLIMKLINKAKPQAA
jgi:hypothetical protein